MRVYGPGPAFLGSAHITGGELIAELRGRGVEAQIGTWHMPLITYYRTKYGFRADGRYDPDQGYFFDPAKLLVDPYAIRLDRAFVQDPLLAEPRSSNVDTASLVPKLMPSARGFEHTLRAGESAGSEGVGSTAAVSAGSAVRPSGI